MSYDDPILGPLNESQREAVLKIKGPALILAGAGSGKTRTLTHRIAYMIKQGIPPWQILAVTFTNKAAAEMKERIRTLLKITNVEGTEREHLPASGTFHSICARILRRDIEHIGRNRNYVIYDSDDQEKVMKLVLRDMKIPPEEIKTMSYNSALERMLRAAKQVAWEDHLPLQDLQFRVVGKSQCGVGRHQGGEVEKCDHGAERGRVG